MPGLGCGVVERWIGWEGVGAVRVGGGACQGAGATAAEPESAATGARVRMAGGEEDPHQGYREGAGYGGTQGKHLLAPSFSAYRCMERRARIRVASGCPPGPGCRSRAR